MNNDQKNPNELDGIVSDGVYDEADDCLTDEELDLLRQSVAGQKIDRSSLPPHDVSSGARAIRFAKKNLLWVIITSAGAICLTAIIVLATVFMIRRAKSAQHRRFCNIRWRRYVYYGVRLRYERQSAVR